MDGHATPFLPGLLAREEGPFHADPAAAASLAGLLEPLSREGQARLAGLLHRAIDRREPTAPLLVALRIAATCTPPDTTERLLATLGAIATLPDLSALLLRGVRGLLVLDPSVVPPWLLLVRLFHENGRSIRDLAAMLPPRADDLPRARPGDTAVKLIHLTAALKEAGVRAPLFCRAIMELSRGAATLPALVGRLFSLFLPPALERAGGAPLRRIGTGQIHAARGDLLLALPVDLHDGILPPGSIRMRDGAGEPVDAGYLLPVREGEFLLEAESPRGTVATRRIAMRLDEAAPPPGEPPLLDERYRPSDAGRFDALNFLTGFIAGFDEPAAEAPPVPAVDRAALLRASLAYKDSARAAAIASTLRDLRETPRVRPPDAAAEPADLLIY